MVFVRARLRISKDLLSRLYFMNVIVGKMNFTKFYFATHGQINIMYKDFHKKRIEKFSIISEIFIL